MTPTANERPPSPATGRNRRRLGRGLDSLIADPVRIIAEPGPELNHAAAPEVAPAGGREPRATGEPPPDAPAGDLRMVPLDSIVPSPGQPRRSFDEAGVRALAESIREAGLMQPIVLRPRPADDQADGRAYEIVAGERRWRAAQLLGLAEIPALIRVIDDQTAAELALIENIQREDLNPIERARAFQRLADEFSLTHQEIARRVGLERATISNHLRLLELDEATLRAVAEGRLSMGHARALLACTNLSERRRLGDAAAKNGWSVREIERRAAHAARASAGEAAPDPSRGMPDPRRLQMRNLEKRLSARLGTRVTIQPGRARGAGRMVISFYSLDQFEGLLQAMGVDAGD